MCSESRGEDDAKGQPKRAGSMQTVWSHRSQLGANLPCCSKPIMVNFPHSRCWQSRLMMKPPALHIPAGRKQPLLQAPVRHTGVRPQPPTCLFLLEISCMKEGFGWVLPRGSALLIAVHPVQCTELWEGTSQTGDPFGVPYSPSQVGQCVSFPWKWEWELLSHLWSCIHQKGKEKELPNFEHGVKITQPIALPWCRQRMNWK